jgi:exodeoxyribonuclease-1
MLQSSQDLAAKLAAVFNEEMNKEELDPDFMIYSGGFFGDNDKSLMQTIRSTSATDLGRLDLPFRDKRLREMLFRYRARNYKETLNVDELARWERFRQQKLSDSALLQRYQLDMDAATERAGEKDAGVLAQVRDYADSLTLAS